MSKKQTLTKYGLLAVLAVVTVLCFSLSLAFAFSTAYAAEDVNEPVLLADGDDAGEVACDEHTYGLVIGTPATKMTYNAFDKFDTKGLTLYKECTKCGGDRTAVTDIEKIEYSNGDCFRYGDDSVVITAAGLTCTVSGITVEKVPTEVEWQWRDGATWRTVTKNTEWVYDGEEVILRAVFGNAADKTYTVDDIEIRRGEDKILNAGEYRVAFDATAYTDYELLNYVIDIEVSPLTVNLMDTAEMLWMLQGATDDDNTNLQSGMLYIYSNGNGDIYPSLSQLADAGWTLINARNVVYSYARYTRDEVEVCVRGNVSDPRFTVDYDDDSDLFATDVGEYRASATLTANKNCKFVSLASNSARGLEVTVSKDGMTAVVHKTWYIAEVNNELLNESASMADGDWVEYSVSSWTYGANARVQVPRLAYGDELISWRGKTGVVTITLSMYRNGNVVWSKIFDRSDFTRYINSTMPAGDYVMEVNVAGLEAHPTTQWWDGANVDEEEGVYYGFDRRYEFSVIPATVLFDMEKEDDGYAAYDWQLNADNKASFFDGFVEELSEHVGFTNIVPVGYWATSEAEVFYGDYEVTYNIARMYTDVYYPINNSDMLAAIKGGTNATYTVYFRITAPNHKMLTETGEGRFDFYFTVTVYEVIDVPTVSSAGLVYTGSKVVPEVADSNLYQTVWSDTDEYVAGGEHSVSFKLYDSVHYRWNNQDGDTVSANFTVAKAENSWIRVPNIVDWNYQSFDTQVNRIRAVVRFRENAQSIKFSIVDANNNAIEGLTDFNVNDDGTIANATLIAKLKELKAGKYHLVVTVAETNNYLPLNQSVEFAIGKAINTWAEGDDDLVLPSWIVGKFNVQDNPIVVKAAHGEAVIEIRDINGKVYYTSTKPNEHSLNDLEVGKYLLVAWVAESDDYAALAERTFTIDVLERVGMPWWGTTLVAVGALAIAAVIIFILWKKGIFQILTGKLVLAIRTRATIDATIAAIRANKLAEEAQVHVSKAKARDRLKAVREAERNKSPEQKALELQARAEVTAMRADEMHEKASKMRQRADKLSSRADESQTDEPKADE